MHGCRGTLNHQGSVENYYGSMSEQDIEVKPGRQNRILLKPRGVFRVSAIQYSSLEF